MDEPHQASFAVSMMLGAFDRRGNPTTTGLALRQRPSFVWNRTISAWNRSPREPSSWTGWLAVARPMGVAITGRPAGWRTQQHAFAQHRRPFFFGWTGHLFFFDSARRSVWVMRLLWFMENFRWCECSVTPWLATLKGCI